MTYSKITHSWVTIFNRIFFSSLWKCLRQLGLNDHINPNNEFPQRLLLVAILLTGFYSIEIHLNCYHMSSEMFACKEGWLPEGKSVGVGKRVVRENCWMFWSRFLCAISLGRPPYHCTRCFLCPAGLTPKLFDSLSCFHSPILSSSDRPVWPWSSH